MALKALYLSGTRYYNIPLVIVRARKFADGIAKPAELRPAHRAFRARPRISTSINNSSAIVPKQEHVDLRHLVRFLDSAGGSRELSHG